VDTKDKDAGGTAVAFAPHQQAYVGVNWSISDNTMLFVQLHHVMDREREPGDTRPKTDDYTLAHIALKYQFTKRIDLQVVANNILSEDAREPSLWSNPANIPNDLPLADRNYQLELRVAL